MKIIISGGGTGGHIFPALAIAGALKNRREDVEILFVGAKGRMEMEKVPAAGYKIEGLWISGLERRFTLRNFIFPLKVIASMLKSIQIIRRFKPDVVVGTGGFASGPLLRVASVLQIPTLIQEQNSFPGITNRILAKKVNRICVAYQGMERYFPKDKILLTGNPVRQDILSVEKKREEAVKFFGLDENKKTFLALGGSLGARTINESIAGCLELLAKNNIQIVWQTGKNYTHNSSPFGGGWVGAFITRMDYAYAAADVVVSRAGAIALSELAIVKKPAILIPSPNVAEDHQTKNAMALVKDDAAILIRDNEAKEKLGREIIKLFNDTEKQKKLSENISRFAFPGAAEKIAEEIIKIVNRQ